MARLARRDSTSPTIRKIVAEFRSGVLSAKDAFRKVIQTIPYVNDPGRNVQVDKYGLDFRVRQDEEFLIAPTFLFDGSIRGGDCDDMATALASLLLALGYRVWFKVIAWRRHDYTHVYVLAEIPGIGIVPMDPVYRMHIDSGFGWEKPGIKRTEIYPV